MRILGIASYHGDTYIAEIDHSEIEKFLKLYHNGLTKLKVGQVVDLGRGYDFASEAKATMKATSELIEKNKKVVEAILNDIQIIGRNEENSGGE